MQEYIQVFVDSFLGTLNWTWRLILFEVPWYTNYFWGLIIISCLIWLLEIFFPWRKNQSIFRKDFWLDAFYMFFNFFGFAIVINGFYSLFENIFLKFDISKNSFVLIDMTNWSNWLQLVVFFIVLDFVQWFTHILLHRFPFLWEFHKIHHSVKEMGFAAHLRYHWMENILYKPLKMIGIMILGGFEPEQAYLVHFFAITIGHLNHANLKITWGTTKVCI